MTVSYAVNQNLGCHLSHFFDRNMHSCEHWRYILCNFNVIHTDDRDIVRNAIATFVDRTDRTDRCDVIHAEKSSYVRRTFQNSFGSLITGFGRAGNIGYDIFVKINMIFLQSITISFISNFIFGLSDISDLRVSLCDQMAHGIRCDGISVTDDLIILGI